MDEKLKKKLQMAAPKKQVCDNDFLKNSRFCSSRSSNGVIPREERKQECLILLALMEIHRLNVHVKVYD